MNGIQNIIILITSLWPLFMILPTYEIIKNNMEYKFTLIFLVSGGFLANDLNSMYLRLFSEYKDSGLQNKYTLFGCMTAQFLTINIINDILKKNKLSYYAKKSIIITKYLLLLNIFMRLFLLLLTKCDLSNESVRNNILWKWNKNQIEKSKCPFHNIYKKLNECQDFKTQLIAFIMISLLILTTFKKY